ncbi:MAG: hypothetical protein JWO53_134 [Chlamydiia bacterium]|nr:hypothetical protein [Chlamydiia bacterium]
MILKTTEFKQLFGEISRKNGFSLEYGGWFKESNECIFVLDLQKSNYSNLYYLNIKVFIQGSFGRQYSKEKDLVKKKVGNIFIRQPMEYNNAFDLESTMTDNERRLLLENLFVNFLNVFSNKVLTKAGIKELVEKNEIPSFPATKAL